MSTPDNNGPQLVHIGEVPLAEILAHGEQAYPQECCGLLVGFTNDEDELVITRTVTSPNMASNGGLDTFEVDPQVRFDVMRSVEGTGTDIVGHYHSHPDHPAKPSATDLDMAFEPEMVWLIVSVHQGQAERPQAWRLDGETRTCQALKLKAGRFPHGDF